MEVAEKLLSIIILSEKKNQNFSIPLFSTFSTFSYVLGARMQNAPPLPVVTPCCYTTTIKYSRGDHYYGCVIGNIVTCNRLLRDQKIYVINIIIYFEGEKLKIVDRYTNTS